MQKDNQNTIKNGLIRVDLLPEKTGGNQMSKVSVIVPIYNVEPFIEKCVQSIIKQDHKDIEIILVDDGSPDGSGKIIDYMSVLDDRIKVIHKENEGVSSARNAGIKAASGEFIMFIDGDDYVDTTYVSSFLCLIEDKNIDIGLSYGFATGDKRIGQDHNEHSILSGEEACKQLYLNKTGVAVWNKIYRRKFLQDNNITFHEEYWFAEGMTFNIECFSKSKNIAAMNVVVYYQTSNAQSAVRKFNLDSWYCGRRAMEYQRTLISEMDQSVIDAWNYHYRQYNYSILCGIIKTNSLDLYSEEVEKCISGLRSNILYPLKVDIGIKAKLKSLACVALPIKIAKHEVKKEILAEKLTDLKITGGGYEPLPRVSIIVAIYKSEKFLRKLIESLIHQTYSNIEIILVDDGSPDNSGLICDEYAVCDNRIIVIHKKNGGACEARNYGLERATGEYVSIIDGDDWLETDYVEYLLKLAIATDSEMSMTDKIFTTRDRIQEDDDSFDILTPEEAFCYIIYPRIPIGPWNKLYKTEMLRRNNITFSRPWSGEGLYFASMAAQCSNHVGLAHRKVYNYRLNNTESGLTNYNLVMGTNAAENIRYIGESRLVRTKRTENAVNWHIWKNYGFQLFLIIATDSIEENKSLYETCIREMRKRLPAVIIHSELGPRTKARMVLQGMFPVWFAKRDLEKNKKALASDTME